MSAFGIDDLWHYRTALGSGLLVTLELNAYVLTAGTVAGVAVGALRLSHNQLARLFARGYVDLFRSIPGLVLLVWLYFALPLIPGMPFRLNAMACAVVGLALNLSAFVAEIFRAGMLAVPAHHVDAGKVLGFSRGQVSRYITGPIALRLMMPPLFGQYINQIKLSVLASTIAVPELLHTINSITMETFRPLELYTALAVIFLVILIPCTYVQGQLEKTMIAKTLFKRNGNGGRAASKGDGHTTVEAAIPSIGHWKMLPAKSTLEVKKLNCGYQQLNILEGVSFDVAAGSVMAIIGPNGCGKSTLLKSLANLLPSTAGLARISDGRPLHLSRLGYVSQDHDPFPHLTVEENLVMPLMVADKKPMAEARKIAEEWLRLFKLVEHAKARPATLSGGQRQRLVLARTLCLQPEVLLLDEATSAMDFRWTLSVNRLLRKLADAGMMILAVSHGSGFIRTVADDVVFLDDGQVIEQGPATILISPQTKELQTFLEAA